MSSRNGGVVSGRVAVGLLPLGFVAVLAGGV